MLCAANVVSMITDVVLLLQHLHVFRTTSVYKISVFNSSLFLRREGTGRLQSRNRPTRHSREGGNPNPRKAYTQGVFLWTARRFLAGCCLQWQTGV